MSSSAKQIPGWELITKTLYDLTNKMREVENESYENNKKSEALYAIRMLHHQRS